MEKLTSPHLSEIEKVLKNQDRGRFLIFEGLDGSGKTTLMARVEKALRKAGKVVVKTREPGGSAVGEKIRSLLLDPTDRIHPQAELFLFEAVRVHNILDTILPALEKGYWVLGDRFRSSSIAFQAAGRGLGKKWVDSLNDWVCGRLDGDLTILLDIPFVESMARKKRRDQQEDRIERESQGFHERVRESFLALGAKRESWIVLDATEPEESLETKVLRELRKRQWLQF